MGLHEPRVGSRDPGLRDPGALLWREGVTFKFLEMEASPLENKERTKVLVLPSV